MIVENSPKVKMNSVDGLLDGVKGEVSSSENIKKA
jgi:hypothetical protein